MDLSLMFAGRLWILPFGIGLVLIIWWFYEYFIRKQKCSISSRLEHLRLGRNLIPILPLSGILGTVFGLMNTLLLMAKQYGSGQGMDLPVVVSSFGTALNTTFWGVMFALICMFLYELAIVELEE